MKIVIDEWDIESNQSIYRRTLSALAVDKMKNIFRKVIEDNCNGCIIDHPSQLQHPCLFGVSCDKVEEHFEQLLTKIDLNQLNVECCKKKGYENLLYLLLFIFTQDSLFSAQLHCY